MVSGTPRDLQTTHRIAELYNKKKSRMKGQETGDSCSNEKSQYQASPVLSGKESTSQSRRHRLNP